MLENDRVQVHYNQALAPHSKAVVLQHIHTEKMFKFDSLGSCIKFLKSEGHKADQRTLVKRLNTEEPYYNYMCLSILKN